MRKKVDPKPFIYYDNLKPWETVCIILYSTVTVIVLFTLGYAKPTTKQTTIMMYALISQLSLYFGLYTSLRNFKSYLIWFGFGLIHLILFWVFKGSPDLEMKRGNPAIVLLNTLPLLLLFQLLRYVSKKIQHREFVAPARGGGSDLIENRTLTFADFVIFVLYMASWFGLLMLSVQFE